MKALTKNQGATIASLVNAMTVADMMWAHALKAEPRNNDSVERWSKAYYREVELLADLGVILPTSNRATKV